MNTTNEPLQQWKPIESLRELKRGDVVRVNKNPHDSYVVSDIQPKFAVAVRTGLMTHLPSWELLVTEPEPQEPKEPELFPCPVCDGNAKGYPDKMEFGCPQCGVWACSRVEWNAIPRLREKK